MKQTITKMARYAMEATTLISRRATMAWNNNDPLDSTFRMYAEFLNDLGSFLNDVAYQSDIENAEFYADIIDSMSSSTDTVIEDAKNTLLPKGFVDEFNQFRNAAEDEVSDFLDGMRD